MKRIFWAALLLLAFPTVVFANGDGIDERIKMSAEILSVGDEILVEVLESEYTSGIHIVLTGEDTVYLNGCCDKISREDLKVGDRVEIFYNGQVMMSYPPKIVARKIIRE